jgi:hypothetical protein
MQVSECFINVEPGGAVRAAVGAGRPSCGGRLTVGVSPRGTVVGGLLRRAAGRALGRRVGLRAPATLAGSGVGQGSGSIDGVPNPALKRTATGRPLPAVVHVASSGLPVTAA